jgi:hypothetical protein
MPLHQERPVLVPMLHLNILDGKRQSLLPLITTVAEGFY